MTMLDLAECLKISKSTHYNLAQTNKLRAHSEFRMADLEARQTLYLQLAKRVWDPALVRAELGADS